MFTRRLYSIKLAINITVLNAVALILALMLLLLMLDNKYKNDEQALAKEKLSFYWTELARSEELTTLFSLRNLYARDLSVSVRPYGLRIADKKQNTVLIEYPELWEKYLLPLANFSDIAGAEHKRLTITSRNKLMNTNIDVYSIQISDYTIQILISIEERINFLLSILQRGIAIIVGVVILSFLFAKLIISRVLKPLLKINHLIEEIIVSHDIPQRLEIKGRGEFVRLQKNFNTMLDVIERQVHRLRQATISLGHDIRTPLTHIRNQLESLLSMDTDTEKIEECLDSLNELKVFAKQILDLSEIEQGLSSAPNAPINIKEAIADVLEVYSIIVEDKGIHLECNIDNDAMLYIDGLRLRQLVGNLLDNAVKFSPENTTIRFSVTQHGTHVHIIVEDEGKGIAQEDIKYICLPAWRKDREHTHTGSGFGLAIVESILQVYRGTMVVKSEVDVGTKITIAF